MEDRRDPSESAVRRRKGGNLTEAGARLLDESGTLKGGIPMCPPEGDAGTGMTATNSVTVRTGNVSAGTSVFAMLVLENELKGVHREIDMVTTPAGDPVAMVHCNKLHIGSECVGRSVCRVSGDDGDGCGQKPTVRNSLQKGNGGRGRRRRTAFLRILIRRTYYGI